VGMIRLVYISFATKIMSDEELRNLLQVAREKNKELDVTGMLLYRDGFFIQALEGEEETVLKLYNKIKTDPRHRSVLQIFREPMQQRSFGEWSMGFNKLEADSLENVEGYTDFLKKPSADFFAKDPNYAKMLLNMFRTRSYF
jgi:Sensors of blue-light using FAD